ncbi:hypothetical protein Zmor_018623 [Zophobas morio]|uniref:Ankyrin repeat protein n=1 Tax=Zophobas morio TaxID=2755281 RepID=A0AA38IEW7_9CUCU|nr:hypothetical protein Zmor_018623 [Zophobas morio]
MYKIFFDGKLKSSRKKVVGEHQDHQIILMGFLVKLYEILALKTCLNTLDFEKLRGLSDMDTDEHVSEIKKNGDKYGIIKDVTQSGEAVFYHQTFAEYFACSWLQSNRDKILLLRDEIFSNRYENLRLMLDIMLAEKNPLHLAIIYKSIDHFEKSTNINIKDAGGRTALHLVCTYGMKHPEVLVAEINREEGWYLQMTNRLIEDLSVFAIDVLFKFDCLDYSIACKCLYSLELEHPNKYQNALHYALLNEGSHKDIIDLLAQNGVDVNGKDENGTTPIHRAGATGDITDLELILKNRGELTLLDNKGRNVLHYAASRCTEDVPAVLFLIRNGLSINSRDKNKKTPLHKACHCGNFLVAETLLKEGAQLDSVDINNENALHYATSNIFNPFDSIKIMRLLLERGININAQNNEGATPLHLACKYVNELCVEELLKNEVDVDVLDNNKENALHYAMKTATEESFVEVLLLDFKIDINAQNKQGTTALHLACQRGILECVEILLENGADVNIRDNDNKNALCYVSNTSKDKLKIINVLIESGIDRDDED